MNVLVECALLGTDLLGSRYGVCCDLLCVARNCPSDKSDHFGYFGLVHGPRGDAAAQPHDGDSVGHTHQLLHVMGHDDHADIMVEQVADRVQHLRRFAHAKCGCRFIQNDDPPTS